MNKCSYNPEEKKGSIGMFHCPECGEMVLAGLPHPDYSEEVVSAALEELRKQEEKELGLSSNKEDWPL